MLDPIRLDPPQADALPHAPRRRPCPFCGSTDLRASEALYFDDDGEQPGIECLTCDAVARLAWWDQRV